MMQIIEEAKKLRKYIEDMSVNLDDETALDNVDVFPLWKAGVSYQVNDRIRYNEVLYKCIQAHVSQIDWTPDVAVSLFVRVTVEEWPEWVQPTGAHDAYNTGDKVSHNGKHWISLIDANVWEPTEEAVTLWEEVPLPNEEPSEPIEEPEEEQIPLFLVGYVYNTGDKVLFEDEIYRSLIDNNVWSPTDYPQGWEEIGGNL